MENAILDSKVFIAGFQLGALFFIMDDHNDDRLSPDMNDRFREVLTELSKFCAENPDKSSVEWKIRKAVLQEVVQSMLHNDEISSSVASDLLIAIVKLSS